jgi:DNA (cytosine-5)-methyltransferase 1
MRQLGNAVPVHLAYCVASSVAEKLLISEIGNILRRGGNNKRISA